MRVRKVYGVLLALIILVSGAFLRLPQAEAGDVCPQGDGWSSHQDPPLSNVGASNYCVKGGSENSEGCDGYLDEGGWEYVNSVVDAENACGLSHWSYELPDPTDTPVPTDTPTATDTEEPTPTETATEGPSPTPTDTATEGPSPTPTNTSEIPEPTATQKPPTRHPPTGPEDAVLPVLALAIFGSLFAGGLTLAARRMR